MGVRFLFEVVIAVYILSAIFSIKQRCWVKFFIGAGLIIQTIGLLILSFTSGHPPFSNLYESLLFLSFLIPFIWLIGLPRFQWTGLGSAAALLAVAGILASLAFPWQAKPLMPALQSPWLHIHVSSCFLAYAFFGLAAISAFVSLFKDEGKRFSMLNIRLIKLGVPLLSFGIISGAMWAYYAWGRYWGWDPKEVWALISWLFYLGILHTKFLGLNEKTVAILSITGFVLILFTFLGVNLILSGLHSYV